MNDSLCNKIGRLLEPMIIQGDSRTLTYRFRTTNKNLCDLIESEIAAAEERGKQSKEPLTMDKLGTLYTASVNTGKMMQRQYFFESYREGIQKMSEEIKSLFSYDSEYANYYAHIDDLKDIDDITKRLLS